MQNLGRSALRERDVLSSSVLPTMPVISRAGAMVNRRMSSALHTIKGSGLLFCLIHCVGRVVNDTALAE